MKLKYTIFAQSCAFYPFHSRQIVHHVSSSSSLLLFFFAVPAILSELLWELLKLNGAVVERRVILGVEAAPRVHARLPPVGDERHPAGEVQVQRVQPVPLAVVDVPLLPRHVPFSHRRVLVKPVRGHHARHVRVEAFVVHRVEPIEKLAPPARVRREAPSADEFVEERPMVVKDLGVRSVWLLQFQELAL